MVQGEISRLPNFPISWFAMVMGLAGLTIALHRAETVFEISFGVSQVTLVLTIAVFTTLALIYALKVFRYPGLVKAEFNHPIRVC